MSGVVMTERATRLDKTSIIPLTIEDQNSEPVRKMKEEFESILKSKLKDRIESLTAGKGSFRAGEVGEGNGSSLEEC